VIGHPGTEALELLFYSAVVDITASPFDEMNTPVTVATVSKPALIVQCL
jgi:hypothetical protein